MDNEKKKKLEKYLEAWKGSPQFKALQENLKAITEGPAIAIQISLAKSLEPIQQQLEQVSAKLKQASISFWEKLDEHQISFDDAKEFYKRVYGKAPLPYTDFLDWFFFVKHRDDDGTLGEVTEKLRYISTEDVRKATDAYIAEYEKKTQQSSRKRKPLKEGYIIRKDDGKEKELPDNWKRVTMKYVSERWRFKMQNKPFTFEQMKAEEKKRMEGQVQLWLNEVELNGRVPTEKDVSYFQKKWKEAEMASVKEVLEQAMEETISESIKRELVLYLEYLETNQPEEEQPQHSKSQEPITKLWALYYWYLGEANLYTKLQGKKTLLFELAKKHGISQQNFYLTFNAIGQNSEKNPKRNLNNIRKVIPWLADFPEAQKLAEAELKGLEKKK